MGLINGTVYLENNYELWKEKFHSEKRKLEKIFNNEEFTIEHVGSTSIKGLSAKPIVDIAIGVQSLDDIKPHISKLSELYTIKETGSHLYIENTKPHGEFYTQYINTPQHRKQVYIVY